MIGNRVRVIRDSGPCVQGTLHKIDSAGAFIYREHSLPEGQGTVFIPMARIVEIVDLGRMP